MAQDVGRFESLFSAPPEKIRPSGGGSEAHQQDLGPHRETETYEDLERKYRHRTYQAQELMVEKLLRGHFIDTRAVERKLMMFELDFRYDNYMLVLVCPAGNATTFSDYESDLRDGGQVGLIVSSIFSELLGEKYACYPANLEDRYAFLLNLPETDVEEARHRVPEICRDAVRFILENFAMELQVCVSDVSKGIGSLNESFRETEIVAADAKTSYTGGVCAKTESEPNPAMRRPEPTIEKQYLNAIVTQDFQMALQLTLERARELYADGGDLDRVKRFLNMRIQTTGSVLATPWGALLESRDGGERSRPLDRCGSMEELEQTLQQIFGRLDSHYNAVPTDYTGTTGKVIQLIHKKYMEPDLSVEMICDCLGKSRSYLSRMFKENTGMNLLDYLHTTRLTEAKKLLNETDLGISEIASQVGYYSGWTLARVFKRYEGITPTAYRKAFCGLPDA